MSSLIMGQSGTSAVGTARDQSEWQSEVFFLGVMLVAGTGSTCYPLEDLARSQIDQLRTSSLSATAASVLPQSTAAAVSELRRLSGLTWEQLARVLGVSRRSLHFWASGQSINASNEDHLRRTLMVLNQADRGTALANREMLMEDHDGVLPLDLLTDHTYDEFLRRVGLGAGRRKLHLQPLSRAAVDARKPSPPGTLIDALQDRGHIEPGRLLSAAPIRRKREK